MGFAKIKGKLTSRIGRKVTFGRPADVNDGSKKTGVIVDETWADDSVNILPPRDSEGAGDWGDYSFCAQLIRWDDKGDYAIRLGYFRRRAGEDSWEFASQYTITEHWSVIKPLLERTLEKESWFADDPQKPSSAVEDNANEKPTAERFTVPFAPQTV